MATLPRATTAELLLTTMAPLPELPPTTTIMETVEPTSTATHTPAKLRPLQLPNTTTTAHQDLLLAPPLAPATPEAQDPPTTPTTTLTAAATQDLLLRQTPLTAQVAATLDPLTATHHPAVLPTAQAIETVAVAHTPDLLAAVPAVLPPATQDLLQAAVHPVHPAEATQAPAAQDQAEAAIQEAVTQAAVHPEAHTQAVEAQEEAPLQAEDKFRIQNTKSNIQKHLTSRCFFYWHISTLIY